MCMSGQTKCFVCVSAYRITLWSRDLFEKLTVTQLVNKFSASVEPIG